MPNLRRQRVTSLSERIVVCVPLLVLFFRPAHPCAAPQIYTLGRRLWWRLLLHGRLWRWLLILLRWWLLILLLLRWRLLILLWWRLLISLLWRRLFVLLLWRVLRRCHWLLLKLRWDGIAWCRRRRRGAKSRVSCENTLHKA
jgi:hypothetical protein